MKMVLFDTETTGLPKPQVAPLKDQPQIIEFYGMRINLDTMEKEHEVEFIANPGKPLPKIITEITGLTDADLKDKPPFANFMPDIQELFLGTKYIVAHNLKFDLDMLMFEMRRIDAVTKLPWPPVHIDTVSASYSIKGHRLKLSDLHKIATGDTFEGAHRAKVDVEALWRCTQFLMEEGRIKL